MFGGGDISRMSYPFMPILWPELFFEIQPFGKKKCEGRNNICKKIPGDIFVRFTLKKSIYSGIKPLSAIHYERSE